MPGQFMGRQDPPESDWAGRWVTEEDVNMACGDERDWFTYEMRLRAFRQGWARYTKARAKRRKMASKFKFAQIMLIGDMGASKTTMAAWESYKWHQRGHVVFHNGPFLFGRMVEGAGIYEIVDQVPRNSVIAIDEAHTGLESGMSMSSGVRSFTILCAGLRKKNCRLILMTAMAVMVSRKIRDMTSEVWRPNKPNVQSADFGYKSELPGHSDPKNFIFCWDVWHDFPFRGEDLTSSKGRHRGFGPPDDTRIAQGEGVRNAFLLTDSFQPVETAVAQSFATKDAMTRHRETSKQGLTQDHRKLIGYLWQRANEDNPPSYINNEVLALQMDLPASRIGRLMSGLFGDVDGIKTARGYHMETVMDAIEDKFNITPAE